MLAIDRIEQENDLHDMVRGAIGRMHEYGTKEHKEFSQQLLTKYTAANNENKDKKTYSQDWTAYNEAQQKEKILLMSILDELLSYIKFPEDKGVGRNPMPMRDKIFYLIMQTYNTKSSRRCISDLEIARRFGYISKTPHFNTVLKCINDESLIFYLTHLIRISGLPLKDVEKDFAIDSTGFSTSQFGRWFDIRTKSDSLKRKWRKAHITCGVLTNIITAVNVTIGSCGDSPELPRLIKQTGELFNVREVSADKAYISINNLETIWDMGAIPFIPFKSNSNYDTDSGNGMVWRKMLKLYTEYPEEFYHHYHKRSNIESTNNMIKSKFGSHLRSKNWIGQNNEILTKCLCHNLCVLIQEAFELKIEIDFKKYADIEIAHK